MPAMVTFWPTMNLLATVIVATKPVACAVPVNVAMPGFAAWAYVKLVAVADTIGNVPLYPPGTMLPVIPAMFTFCPTEKELAAVIVTVPPPPLAQLAPVMVALTAALVAAVGVTDWLAVLAAVIAWDVAASATLVTGEAGVALALLSVGAPGFVPSR